nr:MAG TPA: aspartate racemase [Caudoviricetes sp.]
MFNVLLGCTHFEQRVKQKYLCNITTDLHSEALP